MAASLLARSRTGSGILAAARGAGGRARAAPECGLSHSSSGSGTGSDCEGSSDCSSEEGSQAHPVFDADSDDVMHWGSDISSEEVVAQRSTLALRHHLSRRARGPDLDDLEALVARRDELSELIQERRRRLGMGEPLVMRSSRVDAVLLEGARMSKVDEKRFEASKLPANIRFGAKALLLLFPFAIANKVLRSTPQVSSEWTAISVAWHVLQYVTLCALCVLLLGCWRWPRPGLYFPVIVFYSVTVIVLFVPSEQGPFFSPCQESPDCPGTKSMECVTEQIFFMQVMMFCALFTPWVVPTYRFMRYSWGWIVLAYLASTLWSVNMLASVLFLSGAQVIATNRKFYIERGQRNDFVLAQSENETAELMVRVLRDMVPNHVVKRMLKDPDGRIADEVGRASILFITIVDFDQIARALPGPAEVLELLNSVFTRFDEVCERRKITKIETICEEYVCAVGVEQRGADVHEARLVDLVRAAAHILNLQMQVVFQMGIHTGPVVAGVIGQKLPRFRLFGDTMNTAARMMQKGLPGEVQFGEETRASLPSSVAVRRRGLIEMKGKGQLVTYFLDLGRQPNQSPTGSPSQADTPMDQSAREDLSFQAPWPSTSGVPTVRSAATAISDAFHLGSGSGTVPHAADAADGGGSRPGGSSPNGSHTLRRHATWRSVFGGAPPSPRTLPSSVTGQLGNIIRTLRDVGDGVAAPERTDRSGFHGSVQLREALAEVAPQFSMNVHGGRAKLRCLSVLDWLLPSRDSFYAKSEDNERDFRAWFHEELVCKKITTRTTNQICSLLLVTAVEFGGICSQGFVARGQEGTRPLLEDAYRDLRRGPIPAYLTCRGLCVAILLASRCLFTHNKDWVRRSQRSVQACILSCCWLVSFLLFVSYENVPLQVEPQSIDGCIATSNQVISGQTSYIPLACLPMYTLVTTTYRLPFLYSCTFILLAVFLMIYAEAIRPALDSDKLILQGGIVFSQTGMIVFVLTSALHSFESWEEEKCLRSRYKVCRTLETTRKRIQNILNTLMPRKVFEELQELQVLRASAASAPGKPILCSHRYLRATIAQADLVGFTQLASGRRPHEVVAFVSEIFGGFDRLTDDHEIYKIETVGDAYIAGQAEPPLTRVNSPRTVVVFGLAMVTLVEQWSDRKLREQGEAVTCRVGVHTGACIGGIVGTKMQRYHLFGDLMTCLDIIESTAPPGRVQASRACREAAEGEAREPAARHPQLRFEERQEATLVTSKGESHLLETVGGNPSVATCA